jgi:hypothetical protein
MVKRWCLLTALHCIRRCKGGTMLCSSLMVSVGAECQLEIAARGSLPIRMVCQHIKFNGFGVHLPSCQTLRSPTALRLCSSNASKHLPPTCTVCCTVCMQLSPQLLHTVGVAPQQLPWISPLLF